MRSVFLAAVSVAAIPFLTASNAARAEPKGEAAFDGVTLGEHWYGQDVSVDDLKGRVVLLEFWGYN
jgi:hypothetical protein